MIYVFAIALLSTAAAISQTPVSADIADQTKHVVDAPVDYWSLLFVFVLASIIGLGVIARVSRLLHTPLMSITNAISAIAVMGSIIVTGTDYAGIVGPDLATTVRILGAIALFASMTNIVSGFLITNRMLKMFKEERKEVQQ
jgi:NAD(P) transhydrogenase subunit alpha